MENEPHKIIVIDGYDGNKIELSLHKDANINEWINNFKVILKWITFSDEMINKIFKEDEE